MYKEYFIQAQKNLIKGGFNPQLSRSGPVSKADIDAADARTDYPMPAELRAFFIEMGDAFMFMPHEVKEGPLWGWNSIWLSDYIINNQGFHTAIDEDVALEFGTSHPRVVPEILQLEARRRRKWIPFYDFGGEGDVLCLDAEGKVHYHDSICWTGRVGSCDGFILASSLTDFIVRWSRYSFIAPGAGFRWTSFCWGLSGIFDWAPEHFPRAIRS